MSKVGKVLLTLVLLAGFGAALFFAMQGQQSEVAEKARTEAVASATELTGIIALDVEPFFADERVRKLLADQRLPVKVTRVGSPPPERVLPDPKQKRAEKPKHKETLADLIGRTGEEA